MLQNLRKRNEGFTIIEVLIVLAIAGLIMLVVFLAVPALQRNARNNDRKSDVSRIATAVNEWVSNNNGQVFTAGTGNANLTTVLNSAGTLAQYSLTPGTSFTVATGAQTSDHALDNVTVVTGAKCANNGQTTGAGTRQMAIRYAVETSNGNTDVCLDI